MFGCVQHLATEVERGEASHLIFCLPWKYYVVNGGNELIEAKIKNICSSNNNAQGIEQEAQGVRGGGGI